MKIFTVTHLFEIRGEHAFVYYVRNFSTYEKAYEFMKKVFEQTKEMRLNEFSKEEGYTIDCTILDNGAEVYVGNDNHHVLDVLNIFENNLDDNTVED